MENKTRPNDSVGRASKYFKYALGEIILVVIGILIALSINNWNEKRKSQNRANDLYEKLKIELAQKVEYLEFSYNGIEHQLTYLHMVMNADTTTIDSIVAMPRFGLNPIFYMTSYSQFFDPPSDIYETALNDGSIRLIKDKSLTKILQEFHQSYKLRADQIIQEEYTQGREINNYISRTYASLFEGELLTSEYQWNERIVKNLLLNIPNDGTLKYMLAERIQLKKARQLFVYRFKNGFTRQLERYK